MKDIAALKQVEFNVKVNKEFSFSGIDLLIESSDKKIILKQGSLYIEITGDKLYIDNVSSVDHEIKGNGLIRDIKIKNSMSKETLIKKLFK